MTKSTFTLRASNVFSSPLFLWVIKLIGMFMFKAPEDFVFTISDDVQADNCSGALQRAWESEKTKATASRRAPSVMKALRHAFGLRYLMLAFWKILWALATWGSAWYLLKKLMFTDSRSMTWAWVLLAASVVSAISIQQLYSGAFLIGLKVRASLTMLVYNKSLCLPPEHVGVGEIVNMVSTDIEAIATSATHWHFLWSGCCEVILILALVAYESGFSSIYPIILVVVTLPIQLWLGMRVSEFSRTWITTSGERLHLMTEILTAIKLLKVYTWEPYFASRVAEVRAREAKAAASQIWARAANFAMVFATPVLATLVCLYSLQVLNQLDPATSFVIISLMNTLRYPLLMMPMAVKACSSANNALNSLKTFMQRPELIDQRLNKHVKGDQAGKKGIIDIKSASLSWGDNSKPTLANITCGASSGEVIAVVGTVGSGKSTLIASILGQTNIVTGSVRVCGRTSYCPQEAWLINMSIRDNILFGTAYDKARYEKVIEVCALGRDLSLFPDGDQTMIAERGANLSGGQKQRVSMARAVYAHSDIVLLDDPLSALDQKVGRTIFEKCVRGFLNDRVVVMVTHGLQYLYQVDRIMLMGDGGCLEYGTYTELMAKPGGLLRKLVEQHVDVAVTETVDKDADDQVQRFNTIQIPDDDQDEDQNGAHHVALPVSSPGHRVGGPVRELSETDERIVDRISRFNHGIAVDEVTLKQKAEYDHQNTFGPYHSGVLSGKLSNAPSFAASVARNELSVLTYRSENDDDDVLSRNNSMGNAPRVVKGGVWRYMSLGGVGGTPAAITVIILFFLVHGIRSAIDIWAKAWTGNSSGLSRELNALIFAILCFAFAGGVMLRGHLLAAGTAAKSRSMHDSMVSSLLHAPMSYYDKTPLGRILQAASEHQADADDRLPDAMLQALQYIPLAVGSLVIMFLQSNLLLIPCIAVLGVIAGLIFILPHKSGALKFLYGRSRQTKPRLFSHVATTLEGLFSIRAFTCQARFRSLTIGLLDQVNTYEIASQHVRYAVALYIDVVCSFAIFATAYFFVGTTAKPAAVGLALSNSLQLLVFVQWALRMIEESSSSFVSVRELQSMGANIAPEAPQVITDRKQPDSKWPSRGEIQFRDICLRYTQYGVAVLKRVNFTVQPREKIGIVGRTGSGKSTLLVALMRIVESCQGKILIDGIDASSIGLRILRKRIAIIPQEPVLFLGTVRSNLDPYDESTDDEVWASLAAVHLDKNIKLMDGGLSAIVVKNGRNFSLGQRQLFCIARAILSKSTIVVLDEATAAIDANTDAIVQQAIANNFAECTVLTIAHRLNTIIDSDKILFMDAGRVGEFDKPLTLLDNPNGMFTSLVNQTGPESARKLRQLAQEKADGMVTAMTK